VKRIQHQVAGSAARTTNARNYHYLVQVQARLLQRRNETAQGCTQATARTPDVRQTILPQQSVHWMFQLSLYRIADQPCAVHTISPFAIGSHRCSLLSANHLLLAAASTCS